MNIPNGDGSKTLLFFFYPPRSPVSPSRADTLNARHLSSQRPSRTSPFIATVGRWTSPICFSVAAKGEGEGKSFFLLCRFAFFLLKLSLLVRHKLYARYWVGQGYKEDGVDLAPTSISRRHRREGKIRRRCSFVSKSMNLFFFSSWKRKANN